MTQEELDAIRKRVEAATPGPWFAWESAGGMQMVNTGLSGKPSICACYDHASREMCDAEPNADFIADARTDIPALLDEIEKHKGALRYQTDINIALREETYRLRQELKATWDENERLRAALTDLRSHAETFALVAVYQGTPLTALSKSVEAAWHVLYG